MKVGSERKMKVSVLVNSEFLEVYVDDTLTNVYSKEIIFDHPLCIAKEIGIFVLKQFNIFNENQSEKEIKNEFTQM